MAVKTFKHLHLLVYSPPPFTRHLPRLFCATLLGRNCGRCLQRFHEKIKIKKAIGKSLHQTCRLTEKGLSLFKPLLTRAGFSTAGTPPPAILNLNSELGQSTEFLFQPQYFDIDGWRRANPRL
ncbi:hypothetical protein J6590_008216 [Homalodisca vitripennis]|nr:hypothetical protein J6590_008216 [Homalodisca vitripennis]